MKAEKKFHLILLMLLYSSILFGQEDMNFRCGLNEESMRPVYLRVYENITRLQQEGKLQMPPEQFIAAGIPTPVRFSWPLRQRVHGQYGYYRISNFTDLDTSYTVVDGVNVSTGIVRDYMGNSWSYDGHQGIDIGIGRFHWEDVKTNEVEVIAAADGVIVEKHQGEFYRNCSMDVWNGSTARGNHVVILHNDGSTVSYYMHMKDGSLTERPVGSTIKTGEYLGVVASSGRSTGPHLHFQINVGWSHPDSAKGKFVEPFTGPYNWTTDESLWVNQKDYYEPEIMGMETHQRWYSDADYYLSNCDSTIDLSSLKNSIPAENWTIGYRVFFRDWVTGGNKTVVVRDPMGSAKHLWFATNPNNWRSRYDYREFEVGINPMVGTWSLNVSFNNKIYSHYFTVGCINNYNLSAPHSNNQGFIAGNNITSTATIAGSASNNVEYKADNAVILLPGFTAASGSTFLANTDGCDRGRTKIIR